MPIVDLIESSEVIKCAPDAPIKDVAHKMDQHGVGSILVVDDERLVGIVTDRDIALRCFGDGRDSQSMTIKDVMTSSVECIRQDAGVQDVLNIMKDRSIRRVPVVDGDGKAIGLLSSDDLMRLLAKEIEDLTEAVVPSQGKGHLRSEGELKSA